MAALAATSDGGPSTVTGVNLRRTCTCQGNAVSVAGSGNVARVSMAGSGNTLIWQSGPNGARPAVSIAGVGDPAHRQ